MKSGSDAQLAHDALLAIRPESATHEPCDLCPKTVTKEVAQVSGDNRTYAEAEHLALMADAVKRETAELTTAKEAAETKVSELTARVDVLEAEKASLGTEKDTTQAAFDAYKVEVERAREIETAKSARVEKVKAAHAQLPDSYFTDERIQRWAEMTEEAFASLIEDLTAAGGTPVKTKETAAFSGGTSPTSATGDAVSAGSIFAAQRGVQK